MKHCVQAYLAADVAGARVPVGVTTELVVKLQAHESDRSDTKHRQPCYLACKVYVSCTELCRAARTSIPPTGRGPGHVKALACAL